MEETSSDDSSSNDSFLFESDELVESKVFQDEVNIRQNGIKRKDYRRTKKRAKSQDPWLINYWSQNLAAAYHPRLPVHRTIRSDFLIESDLPFSNRSKT